jgi:outer membrane cobalamin receptor
MLTRFLAFSGIVFVLTWQETSAQQRGERKGGIVTGALRDPVAGVPIEYANVVLYSSTDSTQVAGTASNSQGIFELLRLRPGSYYLRVFYIGYGIKTVSNIYLRPLAMDIDLGTIEMARTAVQSDEVEIMAERLPLTYQLDKKVINAAEFQTAVSGTAVEILEKVPSVSVDVEGNVSLRGSQNFTVLIDGRPSVLDPNDALQQIPAGTIETIEIITNPSAKYNPDGTSGVINIVLKKNRQTGRNGIANLNVGSTRRYGGDVLIEQKNRSYGLTLAVDYNRWSMDGSEEEWFETTQQNLTSRIESDGDSRRGRTSYGVRSSIDFQVSECDVLTVGGRAGFFRFGGGRDLNYREAILPNSPESFLSTTDRKRSGPFYALTLNHQRLFRPKGHEWTSEIFYSRRDGDKSTTGELSRLNDVMMSGQKTTEEGPGEDFRLKTDYLVGSEALKFEAGYQFDLDLSTDRTRVLDFDTIQMRYVADPAFDNTTEFQRSIHAGYSIFSGKVSRLSWQGGIRVEYTDRETKFGESATYDLQRWDVFPTIHLSQEVSEKLQLMGSYTRRINRPRAWYLEPYETRIDEYNVRIGNPDLKPEYIDSYEAGLQTRFGDYSLSSELYYRLTHNTVERVRSVYSEGVTLQSVENIGKDYSLGIETMLSGNFSKKVAVNVIGNVYRYRLKGTLFDEPVSRTSDNWSLRAGTTIRPSRPLQIQVDGNYDSPTISSQGRREGSFMLNGSVRFEFIPRRLTATLQLRDILGIAKFEESSVGPGYSNYRYSTREAPIVMLNLRYAFNRQKNEPRERRRDNDDDDDEF